MEKKVPSRNSGREPASAGSSLLYSDKTVAAALLVICGAIYYLTTMIDVVPDVLLQGMQGATYPRVILAAILPLILLMLYESRRAPLKKPEPVPHLVLVMIALMCAAAAFATWIDFFGGLILFIAFAIQAWGMRRPVVAVAYGIVLAVALNALFGIALGVRFPSGPLTNLLG